MKILYIPVTKKIKEKNLKNYLICLFYDIYVVVKNFFFNKKISKNTSGYIEAAIYSNAYVLELPYNYCIFFSKILNLFFDGIFINFKFTNYRSDNEDIEKKLLKLSKIFWIKKVIVDGTDKSTNIIRDDILDGFDYVIKREKNKQISSKKYLTTMLPCSMVDYKVSKKKENIDWNNIGNLKPNEKFKYDVFFSGTLNNKRRSEAVEFLKSKNLNFNGGFQRLPYNEFIDTIYNSSINLAIAGVHGAEFTFRHLEILSCCSFMICHNEINKLELPIPIKDGEHFITYQNNEDLLEKINFYLKNDHLRSKISLNGRETLVKYYSPKNHGDFILRKIFS